jgi:hypothetical protein
MSSRVVLIGFALMAAVGLFPRRAESPARGTRVQRPPAPLPSVTLAHDFVRVSAAVVAPPARRARTTARTRETATKPARRLLARAGRALLGDGRHRPEPFPRPDR